MHQYWAFGLNISSEIGFPEMLPASFNQPDVTIRIGKVPEKLEGANVVHRDNVSASPTEYLLDTKNIARYYAANGTDVIIEPAAEADINSIRLFMLSNAMAAIIHQRNFIPFHAAAIITGEGLTLFTGRSGIGKSTTVLALMQEGYQLFTDDVCVLHLNKANGRIEAVPSYPMMKVWESTLDQIGTGEMSKDHQLRPDLPKYGLFQHENFTTAPLPVSKVFCLDADSEAREFSCERVNKFKAFALLQQNSYRRGQVEMMQKLGLHFDIITKLAGQSDVFEVTRPVHSDILSFIHFIKAHLDKAAPR